MSWLVCALAHRSSPSSFFLFSFLACTHSTIHTVPLRCRYAAAPPTVRCAIARRAALCTATGGPQQLQVPRPSSIAAMAAASGDAPTAAVVRAGPFPLMRRHTIATTRPGREALLHGYRIDVFDSDSTRSASPGAAPIDLNAP
jgi:hypothetical protein